MPKFIVFVRATPESEKGTPPDTAMLSEMGAYNDTLRAAGMLIAADGLLASAQGARLTYTSSGKSDDVTLTKGPFPWESLVSGFWILEAADLDECVTWAKKAPFRENNQVVEVRKIAKLEDFGGDVLGKTRKEAEVPA